MSMYLVQSLLLIAIAFILGCLFGGLLRYWFGGSDEQAATGNTGMAGTATAAAVAGTAATAAAVSKPVAKPANDVAARSATPEPVRAAPPPPAPAKPADPKKVEPAAPAQPAFAASLPKAKPGAAKDDLKLISGVGPVLEKKLNEYGITTFEQIASLTPAQQAEFSEELNFPGRIERDNWIPQARLLADGKDPSPAVPKHDNSKKKPASSKPASGITAKGTGANKTAAKATGISTKTAKASEAKSGSAKPAAASGAGKANSEDAVKAIAARSGGAAGGKDNLKRVRGIGPVLEGKLNAVGIYRFAQIAEWTAADRKAFNEHLDFPGRIEREEWVKQAKQLAQGKETDFSKRVDKGEVGSSKGKAIKPKNMKKS